MDLFNRQKVQQLQNDLNLANLDKDHWKHEYEQLVNNCLAIDKSLTGYLKEKYEGKYFSFIDADSNTHHINIVDISCDGGLVRMDVFESVDKKGTYFIGFDALGKIKQISKKTYLS